MKSSLMILFSLISLFLGLVHSTTIMYTDEGSVWFYNDVPISKTLYDVPSGATWKFKWIVQTYGLYNTDTGERYMIFEHILQAPIFDTDTIIFELGFTSSTAQTAAQTTAFTTSSTTLTGYDAVRCQLENNSEDPDYWTQTVTDAYYAPLTTDATELTYTVDTTNDWTYWIQDYSDNDDSAITSPFCTYDSAFFSPSVEQYLSIYNCT